MAKIIVHRKKEFIYYLTNFHIFLNGNKINTLKAGETSTLEIESGKYELKIKGGLFVYSNTIRFHIDEHETKKFMTESFKNGFIKNYIKLNEV